MGYYRTDSELHADDPLHLVIPDVVFLKGKGKKKFLKVNEPMLLATLIHFWQEGRIEEPKKVKKYSRYFPEIVRSMIIRLRVNRPIKLWKELLVRSPRVEIIMEEP